MLDLYCQLEIYRRQLVKEFILVAKALSDPNRVKILKMLQSRSMCVCELQDALGIAQPTVSKHLKQLEEAGLVASTKEGLWVNYRLDQGGNPYAAAMLGNLRYWMENDPSIVKAAERAGSTDREKLTRKKQN
jgi:ArsR family transcriptional regulator